MSITDYWQARPPNHSWARRSGLCAVFLLVVLGSITSAFSQQMGSYAAYSDSWVDDSNPDAITIVGTGATQDSQNSYGHTYWVVTTLTSPSGRTTTATSSQTNGYSAYTAVETVLPWDWADPGGYFTQSRHWMCCPYMGGNPYTGAGCYPGTSSSSTSLTGISKAAYYESGGLGDRCTFDLSPGCNVTCSVNNLEDTCDNFQHYRTRWELWVKPPLVGRYCTGRARIIRYFEPPPCVDEPQ